MKDYYSKVSFFSRFCVPYLFLFSLALQVREQVCFFSSFYNSSLIHPTINSPGDRCVLPPLPLSTPPWRQGTGVGCSGLTVTSCPLGWSGSRSFVLAPTCRTVFHLLSLHQLQRKKFGSREYKQGRQ